MIAQVAVAALALAVTGGRRATPAEAIAFHREVLPDGTELVVLPVPDATRSSIRYVVRVGSAFDPPGRDGIAHLLEHVIATVRDGAGSLMEDVQIAGGAMNAFTSTDSTIFALDAPAKAFPALAARLLSAITNPRLDGGDVLRERDVVQSEDDRSRVGGVVGLVEDTLFRAPGSTIGTSQTRGNVSRDELAAFFAARYITAATTVVLAGDVTPDGTKALLDGAFHLPPPLGTEKFGARPGTPILPLSEDIRAPIHGVVLGYRIDEADRALCESLAELVGVRLALSLYVKRPVVAGADVACHTLRGNLFLLASGHSRALDATDLPAEVDAVFRTAGDRLMTASERAMLAQRRGRRLDELRDSPSALAAAAAVLATVPRDGGAIPLELIAPPLADGPALARFARRALDPARRVRITLSPLRN